MAEISRVALFGKLNALSYAAMQGATVFCKMRGNPYVELEHWLAQLLQNQDSDLARIVARYGIDQSVLARDLTAALERLPRGASSVSDLSEHIDDAIERAWVYGTLMFSEQRVRSAHLLIGMLKTRRLAALLAAISGEFSKIPLDELCANYAQVLEGAPEAGAEPACADTQGAPPGGPAVLGQGDALQRFTVDLTARARAGELDPVTGRDAEIRQIVDVLMRRRQNNPLLTGEAGVGKTAVLEGLAQRLARGDVPAALRDVSLLALDVGLLQAGASMRGEFEQRLRQVVDEVQASPRPIVLFIDEVHTLVGAGGAAGTGDAANLLKPALARGTLRTVAATTWAEYKKYIEKDPALTRRFQVVQVPEPIEAQAADMLRGMVGVLQTHHRVQLLDEALRAAVRLSNRYIPARQLPDKAVSLLDTACARVAVSQHATPPALEDVQRRIEALRIESGIVAREAGIGIVDEVRRTELAEALARCEQRRDVLQARWTQEKALVERLLAMRARLGAAPSANGPGAGAGDQAQDAAAAEAPGLAELDALQRELAELQGDDPLVLPVVDEHAVAAVVADWTGIPVGRMVKDEVAAVLRLADTLSARVIGQRHGLEMIARRVQTSRAGLDDPGKPVGVFMLCGTSGVGKTETALALAEALYGGEQNVVTINMSEFQEAHTVSTLKGAPPGYVGYGEGGVLTEAVRRRPYSVVLLDEVEKAHPDVHELFFQVFDKGWMEDGEGRRIDFRNTLILLTSNVGSDLLMSMCQDPDLLPEPGALAEALREPLLKVFPAALLGRIVTIPYYPLSDAMLASIVRLQLNRIRSRVEQNHRIPFAYDEAAVDLIVSRCTEAESGGRVIQSLLTNTVLPAISTEYLTRLTEGRELARVALSAESGEFTYAFE